MPDDSLIKTYTLSDYTIDLLHLDALHPVTGGNKIFKLKYYLIKYAENPYRGIVSFGGPHSNHLAALGHECLHRNIPLIAIIRGDEYEGKDFPLMRYLGSKPEISFRFLNRSCFRELYMNPENGIEFFPELESYLWIPLGGDGEEGIRGASEITSFIPNRYDYIVCAVGSGTTFMGLINGLKSRNIKVVGINVIRNNQYLFRHFSKSENFQLIHFKQAVGTLTQNTIITGLESGGPGKILKEILWWSEQMKKEWSLDLDEVYNAKALYAWTHKLRFSMPKASVLYIHSGGLWKNKVFNT